MDKPEDERDWVVMDCVVCGSVELIDTEFQLCDYCRDAFRPDRRPVQE